MFTTEDFIDYEIIAMSNGEKLEKWGNYYLLRPDPQVIWKEELDKSLAHAHYIRSNKGGGHWETLKKIPDSWQVKYKDLTFNVKLMGFKHTGIFPEQAYNWDFMINKIKNANRQVKVLNLFAYTGGATLACAAAGADEVVHVDASKGMIARAKENISLSKLEDKYVRFIAEDCGRFVDREIRRGRKYHGIIMDPPAYGRGPSGELWKLEEALYPLVQKCEQLLADDGLFFLINSYTTGLSPVVLDSILRLAICQKKGGQTQAAELGFRASKMNIILPCGAVGRWTQRVI